MPLESPYRNPSRWRAVIHTSEVRHGTAGCLLSIVLLAPCFVKQFGFGIVISFVLIYSLIVVPALTNFYSLPKVLMKISRGLIKAISSASQVASAISIKKTCHTIETVICRLFTAVVVNQIRYAFRSLLWLHNFYVSFLGLRVTSNQIIFMSLCERVCGIENPTASLYFLLFYSVLAYLHKSLVTRQWGQNFYDTNVRDFIKLTTWFVAVRLGKGVAMAFVLVVFTTQFNDIDVPLNYIVITLLYFFTTQKQYTGKENLIAWCKRLELNFLEDEEEFWIPFYIRTVPLLLSAALVSKVGFEQLQAISLVGLYTNVLVPYSLLQKDFDDRQSSDYAFCFKRILHRDKDKNAICPVCLDNMRICRVTPCHHAFHGVCLKKWLTLSHLCPLCKQSLKVK